MERAVRLVLQTQLETTRVTEARHRRRQEELDLTILNVRHATSVNLHQLGSRLLTLIPRFQVDHTHTKACALGLGHQAVTGQSRDTLDLVKRQQVGLDLIQYRLATLQRSARRRIHIHVDHTLVLIRDKAGRQDLVDADRSQKEEDQGRISPEFASQETVKPQTIFLLKTEIGLIIGFKETVNQARILFLHMRLQQHRTKGGRQGQGIHTRQNNRHRQSQRELLIEDTDRTTHEADRHEHRRHNQRDGHNSSTDLLHGSDRGLIRRHMLLVHLHVHRLNHHNSVVHHNTDRQNEGEKGQHIDGEAQHLHEKKGTDQGDRNGDRRDQGRTQILQENINDDEHQDKGLQQSPEHGRD